MRRTLAALPLVVLAACSGVGPSAVPSPAPSVPADATFLLRATTFQAVPQADLFNLPANLVITLEGRVLSGAPVEAIFPGPLVYPFNERPITAAGWARIVAAARDGGLLSGQADFTGGNLAPGAAVA